MRRNCPGNSSVKFWDFGKVICVSKKNLENSSKKLAKRQIESWFYIVFILSSAIKLDFTSRFYLLKILTENLYGKSFPFLEKFMGIVSPQIKNIYPWCTASYSSLVDGNVNRYFLLLVSICSLINR